MEDVTLKSFIGWNRTLSENTLTDYIKAVGKRIVEDADLFLLDANRTVSVDISAHIDSDSVTTVEYTVRRIADPRYQVKEDI